MNYKDGKTNVFQQNGQEMDEAIFGEVPIPASGRRVAKPVDLLTIWPDPRQPRRAIPHTFRQRFDGDPQKIGDLLGSWWMHVGGLIQEKMPPLAAALQGAVEWPFDEDDPRPVVSSFVALAHLAAGIHRDGLINAITIYHDGERMRCLTGERRLLAHHLLREYVDREKYSKVLALQTYYSAVQQVAENTQRRDLNAIGMARCYALMLMELWKDEGKRFADFAAGKSDRAFYAQVIDMQVPYGKGQVIQTALNLNSRSSLSNYRLLLALPDEVWQEADESDWPLRQCLDWFEARKTKAPPAPAPSRIHQPIVPERRDVAPSTSSDGVKQSSNQNVQRVEHFPSDEAQKAAESVDYGDAGVSGWTDEATLVDEYPEARLMLELLIDYGKAVNHGWLVEQAKLFRDITADTLEKKLRYEQMAGIKTSKEDMLKDIQQFSNGANAELSQAWGILMDYVAEIAARIEAL